MNTRMAKTIMPQAKGGRFPLRTASVQLYSSLFRMQGGKDVERTVACVIRL